jgi:hypothetical protein
MLIVDQRQHDRGGTTAMQGTGAVLELTEVALDPLAQCRDELQGLV